jgi:hypothetical protein
MEANVFDYEMGDNFVVQPYMFKPETTIEINESDSNDEESVFVLLSNIRLLKIFIK